MSTEQFKGHRNAGAFPSDEIERTLRELESLTDRLRFGSRIIIAFAAATLVSIIVCSGLMTSEIWNDYAFVRLAVVLSWILTPLMGLGFLFAWERTAEQGHLLYVEISDRLEWQHRTFRNRKKTFSDAGLEETAAESWENEISHFGRPSMEVRFVLRRFLLATSLPFAPGTMASMTYAIYFLVGIVFSVSMLVHQFQR